MCMNNVRNFWHGEMYFCTLLVTLYNSMCVYYSLNVKNEYSSTCHKRVVGCGCGVDGITVSRDNSSFCYITVINDGSK